MPLHNDKPLLALAGATPIQRAASGIVFTSANAGICSLTGHLFSLVTPGAGLLFGGSSALIGLGLATRYALNELENCKNMTELADKIAKTILAFFAGGAAGLLLTNLTGFSISAPAALILMGPLITTSLGFLVISVACYAASRLSNQSSGIIEEVRERLRDQVGDFDLNVLDEYSIKPSYVRV
jgi:hypothetical protein